MKEKLMEILTELRPDVDFENCTTLIDDGILDSFDLVSLIGELVDAFGVEISFDDMEPENFNSADSMLEMLQRLESEV
jgi:D-alanine--poly(phosphoribitol) ligase subunit 2